RVAALHMGLFGMLRNGEANVMDCFQQECGPLATESLDSMFSQVWSEHRVVCWLWFADFRVLRCLLLERCCVACA
ncbi:MAG TPA: hypothetical protein VFI87_03475, partial [Hyphomicrobiaceae bacterium]|nr:hypothetical protein [Hyphomicrobiaceae bacterium]